MKEFLQCKYLKTLDISKNLSCPGSAWLLVQQLIVNAQGAQLGALREAVVASIGTSISYRRLVATTQWPCPGDLLSLPYLHTYLEVMISKPCSSKSFFQHKN